MWSKQINRFDRFVLTLSSLLSSDIVDSKQFGEHRVEAITCSIIMYLNMLP